MANRYVFGRKELYDFASAAIEPEGGHRVFVVTGPRQVGVTSIVSYEYEIRERAHLAGIRVVYDYFDASAYLYDIGFGRARHKALARISDFLESAWEKTASRVELTASSSLLNQLLSVGVTVRGGGGAAKANSPLEVIEGETHKRLLKALKRAVRIANADVVVFVIDHLNYYESPGEVVKFAERLAEVAVAASSRFGIGVSVAIATRPDAFDAVARSGLGAKYNVYYAIVGRPTREAFEGILVYNGVYGLSEREYDELYRASGGNPAVATELLRAEKYGEQYLWRKLDEVFKVSEAVKLAAANNMLEDLLKATKSPDAVASNKALEQALMNTGLICRADYSDLGIEPFIAPANVKTKYFWASDLVASYAARLAANALKAEGSAKFRNRALRV